MTTEGNTTRGEHHTSVLIIAENSPDPHFAAERTQNQSVSSAQWDSVEEVVDTEDEDNDGSDTIDPGDLQEYV